MKRLNILSLVEPSESKLSDHQIQLFNDKMERAVRQSRINSQRAIESAKKVKITSI